VDVAEESWNQGTLSGQSRLISQDAYELRIAGLSDGLRQWKLASATVSEADQKAGTAIQVLPSKTGEDGWARVVSDCPETRTVSWALKFDRKKW
jgi:hypothetical protein